MSILQSALLALLIGLSAGFYLGDKVASGDCAKDKVQASAVVIEQQSSDIARENQNNEQRGKDDTKTHEILNNLKKDATDAIRHDDVCSWSIDELVRVRRYADTAQAAAESDTVSLSGTMRSSSADYGPETLVAPTHGGAIGLRPTTSPVFGSVE